MILLRGERAITFMSAKSKEEIESCGYHSVKDIGEGSFSRVYSAVNVEGRQVAVKYFRNTTLEDPIEVDILFRIRHPNLVHGVRTLSPSECKVKTLALVLPLAVTSGRAILGQWQYDYQSRIRIIYQVCCGLEFLHSIGIVHLDIKPDNILISGSSMSPISYLSDFGLAGYLLGDRFLSTRERITFTYRAPEYFTNLSDPVFKEGTITSYRKSADVWSMGATIWAFISGNDLAHTVEDLAAVFSLLSDPSEKREIIENMVQGLDNGAELQDLLSRMLEVDEGRRITMQQVIAHPLFRNLTPSTKGTLHHSPLPVTLSIEEVEERLVQLCALTLTFPYSSLRVEALFLAVDLLYLCADMPFTESTLKHHLIALLQLALTLLALEEQLNKSVKKVVLDLIHSVSIPLADDQAWEAVQKEVLSIVTHLQGILYRPYLYAACHSLLDLESAWENFVRFPDRYFNFDPSQLSKLDTSDDLSLISIHSFFSAEQTP